MARAHVTSIGRLRGGGGHCQTHQPNRDPMGFRRVGSGVPAGPSRGMQEGRRPDRDVGPYLRMGYFFQSASHRHRRHGGHATKGMPDGIDMRPHGSPRSHLRPNCDTCESILIGLRTVETTKHAKGANETGFGGRRAMGGDWVGRDLRARRPTGAGRAPSTGSGRPHSGHHLHPGGGRRVVAAGSPCRSESVSRAASGLPFA